MKDFSNYILIVDDSVAYMRLLLESMIDNGNEKLSGHILFAEDADKGFELYVLYRPMIVLMDVRMPGKSGIDAAKMIVDYDKSANIMLVTNYSNDPGISKAISDKLVNGKIDKGVGVGIIAAMVTIILKTAGKLL